MRVVCQDTEHNGGHSGARVELHANIHIHALQRNDVRGVEDRHKRQQDGGDRFNLPRPLFLITCSHSQDAQEKQADHGCDEALPNNAPPEPQPHEVADERV
eukprot:CAMPEP_0194510088 /NCGR_PEP_ID=MMETSP0253-20130528/41398_1 /TAXON_ID=2966 /ORGANISM="Noctiluca scintillans" /LENGTH=100 /DNA_ID=CAMNT_0039353305 /DNA_START=206 /DNA_END=508 /DNA_ORIENTATION=+